MNSICIPKADPQGLGRLDFINILNKDGTQAIKKIRPALVVRRVECNESRCKAYLPFAIAALDSPRVTATRFLSNAVWRQDQSSLLCLVENWIVICDTLCE